jgi:trigger factor
LTLEIVEISACKKNLLAEIPDEEVEKEIDSLARKYARKVKIPGFRPGKVPLNIIKQRYSADLRRDAAQDMINRCWRDAVEEHDLKPLAEPEIQKLEAEAGNPLKFTLSFEELPPLELTDYKGINVNAPAVKIEDADVDKAIEGLQDQYAQFVPVEDGEIQDGHLATVTLDGEFQDGSHKPIHEENVNILIGGPDTNEGFSENLRGARAGDNRSFDITFPENHHQNTFAGKTVHYRLSIEEFKEKQVAELNDDFAQDVGAESLEALRQKLRDELVTKAKRSAEEKAKEEVLDQVIRSHSFEVPEILIQGDLEARARNVASNLAHQGVDVSKTSIDWKKLLDEERPRAEQAVRRRIVLDAIARQEELEVTEESLNGEFQKLAEGSSQAGAALRAQFEKDQRIQEFRAWLLRNMALDFIYRNATISEG